MKDDEDILDARSTGRKRLRKVLLNLVKAGELEYCCNNCGYVPSIPWNVPSRSGDILDANHKNKNWLDCDPVNGEFLCRPCHYEKDRATEKGVAKEEYNDPYGYGIY